MRDRKISARPNQLARTDRIDEALMNRHMVKLLTEAVKKGARVFAVVGFSHVVMQERALKVMQFGLLPMSP